MKVSGRFFLRGLAEFRDNSFQYRFAMIAMRLELGDTLDAGEMCRLYGATRAACLCNIAFNDSIRRNGGTLEESESERMALERKFMAKREEFLACGGWLALNRIQRAAVARIFFRVCVAEENLMQGYA